MVEVPEEIPLVAVELGSADMAEGVVVTAGSVVDEGAWPRCLRWRQADGVTAALPEVAAALDWVAGLERFAGLFWAPVAVVRGLAAAVDSAVADELTEGVEFMLCSEFLGREIDWFAEVVAVGGPPEGWFCAGWWFLAAKKMTPATNKMAAGVK
ncbi:hypothetical protein ACQ86N_35735 [Puia sp. P3]|uniref:hypothetical protein n=1 Tax=Puia sp. P3 TaxID=3423952 RepID=UPI003D668139